MVRTLTMDASKYNKRKLNNKKLSVLSYSHDLSKKYFNGNNE